MSRCAFCDQEFRNPQAVKAHLRYCRSYLKSKDDSARATSPITPSPAPALATAQGATAPTPLLTPADLMTHLVAQMTAQFAGPDEATRLKQKRESLLAGLCTTLVDWYRPLEGAITPEMAVAAKVALLDELGALPVEELSPTERSLRAEAIRNRVWAPYFRTQKAEREHQKAQLEAQLENQKEGRHQEALRIQHEAVTAAHRVKRKAIFMELGIAQALKAFRSRGFADRGLGLFEWEVRGRLEILLVGDETERQAKEAIEAAIQIPLLEGDKRLEQARLAKRHRIVNQCVTLAVPIVQAALPWVTATVIKKFRETFGMPPSPQSTAPPKQADATSEKPSPPSNPDVTTPHPVRTRPVCATDPIVDRDEDVPPSESGVPEPQERHRAAS
jgi:hypothetical protein